MINDIDLKETLGQLKVLDISSVLAGPLTGSFFAELGCHVTKVENKKIGGDPTRQWKLPEESSDSPISAYYASANYGKEVFLLDFNDAHDRQQLQMLIENHDIIVSNFQKKVAEKYHLNPDYLHANYPEKIICQLSAYDYEDPRPGYDLVMQGETGWLSMNGLDEEHIAKLPVAIIDILASHQMKESILLALLKKNMTGNGSLIHVSLYRSALSGLANQASNYLMAGHIPKPLGTLHPNIAPYGDVFMTKDKSMILLAIGSDGQFKKLWQILGLSQEQYAEFQYNTDRVIMRKKLVEIVQICLNHLDVATFAALADSHNLPWCIIKNLEQVFESTDAQKCILTSETSGIQTKSVSQIAFEI